MPSPAGSDSAFDQASHPHRRYNPLNRSWVLVSPHRAKRPWQGAMEKEPHVDLPAHDPACYLCPGNARAGGVRNPAYDSTFVYDNDFPALLAEGAAPAKEEGRLLTCQPERGICRVLCYSPRHDLTLALMERDEIARVIGIWREQCAELEALPHIRHVQVFENREGNSSPHPHCQIWATERVPDYPATETAAQAEWLRDKGRPLLGEYLEIELGRRERIVCENADFVCLVPFWAVWPYETLILPRRHFGRLAEMSVEEQSAFADILQQTAIRYDNLFEAPFPYSMGIHQSPADGAPHPEWTLHAHFTSSVLRSIRIPKHMVGYERLAEPQRDFTPEWAAQRLRECAPIHYTRRQVS